MTKADARFIANTGDFLYDKDALDQIMSESTDVHSLNFDLLR